MAPPQHSIENKSDRLLNEGVLLQSGAAGALNVFSDENHVNRLVKSARKVVQRIR